MFIIVWLGRKDSNLRMPGPKPGALPLGDAPSIKKFFMIRKKTYSSSDAPKLNPDSTALLYSFIIESSSIFRVSALTG